MLQTWLNTLWYGKTKWAILLWPFSLLFRFLLMLRRMAYQCGFLKVTRFPLPIIIVGNLTVGGTGKTPLVLYVVKQLQQQGFKPGIISRGYAGKLGSQAVLVNSTHSVSDVGDEVTMMTKHCQCPIVVARKRDAAVAHLLKLTDCNVVVSDDGLQHYALARDIEIVVIDGVRRFGNNYLLPAGPLREPLNRLKQANFVVCNGDPQLNEYGMKLQPQKFINIKYPERELSFLKQNKLHAVAGIANPCRFFQTLSALGLQFSEHRFPDHHAFQASDFSFANNDTIVMTEKDAVKCNTFAKENFWYLPVAAECDEKFMLDLVEQVKKVIVHRSIPSNDGHVISEHAQVKI